MKICVATATRAEFGLLKPLMQAIKDHPSMTLQTLVTGAHLSPEFGLTYRSVEDTGFAIDAKVEMLLSADTASSIVKSMGVGMLGYADAFERLKPDLIIILGDRYEILSVASAALIFNMPIAHIHGGEITEGAYDDAIRHSITKMAHLHFASTEIYRQRIIQLGEMPDRVYNVGAIGLDELHNITPMSREQLESSLNIRFSKYNYQVTFHPCTLDREQPEHQFTVLLDALSKERDSFFVFTKANADTGGRIINKMIDDFVEENKETAAAFTSLGNYRFLSLVHHCNAIVGNSSSGILEVPSLGVPTINIGRRQQGRIRAATIIDTAIDSKEITAAFEKVKSTEFIHSLTKAENPYWQGGATQRIMSVLEGINPADLRIKKFYDLDC